MRFLTLLCLVLLATGWLMPNPCCGEDSQAVSLATHNQTLRPMPAADAQAIDRIKKIVLNQTNDARALANLVQLTRNLPAPTTSQLYYDLSNEYLKNGEYNQAANLLQQLLNQHPDQPIAGDALVTLVRLYSSSEVTHTQQANPASAGGQQGHLRYALYSVDRTLQKNPSLGNHSALTFQRAVTARLGGNPKAAQGRLTRLKHNAKAGSWRTRALAEQWLLSKREDEPPLPVTTCRRTDDRPHLDGVLNDSLWQSDEPVQFSYDDGFLYVAISLPKVARQTYQTDARPRSYDADFTGHDQLRLRLDLDRDYATCFEMTVDHRGQTNDNCWLDASWNLQWFLAAGGDDTHWTIEAAIPWKSLTHKPPQPGEAWAVAWNRTLPLPQSQSPGKGASATAAEFSLLLFK